MRYLDTNSRSKKLSDRLIEIQSISVWKSQSRGYENNRYWNNRSYSDTQNSNRNMNNFSNSNSSNTTNMNTNSGSHPSSDNIPSSTISDNNSTSQEVQTNSQTITQNQNTSRQMSMNNSNSNQRNYRGRNFRYNGNNQDKPFCYNCGSFHNGQCMYQENVCWNCKQPGHRRNECNFVGAIKSKDKGSVGTYIMFTSPVFPNERSFVGFLDSGSKVNVMSERWQRS